MIQLLLVTEDTTLEKMLTVSFMINGVNVETISSIGALTDKLKDNTHNALILDSLFASDAVLLREKGYSIPILILAPAYGMPQIKNTEYIERNAEFITIRKKISTLLRAKNVSSREIIKSKFLTIDIQKQMVTIKENILYLGKVETALLVSLVKKTGEIVCRDSMRKDLEDHGVYCHSAIHHKMKHLRSLLKDKAGDTLQIKRITGLGYQLLFK